MSRSGTGLPLKVFFFAVFFLNFVGRTEGRIRLIPTRLFLNLTFNFYPLVPPHFLCTSPLYNFAHLHSSLSTLSSSCRILFIHLPSPTAHAWTNGALAIPAKDLIRTYTRNITYIYLLYHPHTSEQLTCSLRRPWAIFCFHDIPSTYECLAV